MARPSPGELRSPPSEREGRGLRLQPQSEDVFAVRYAPFDFVLLIELLGGGLIGAFGKLGGVTGLSPLGELPEDARAWERGVDELAEEDEDIAEYVRSLEETRDTTELPEASGEAIAREFERYLKRRGEDTA